jgi:hypothetical protein
MPEWPPKEWLREVADAAVPPQLQTALAETVAPAARYQTKLHPAEEREFQAWVRTRGVPFDPSPKADYDMRGFWRALKLGDPRATTAVNKADNQLHFPDTWKTPYHATFSNESIYAPPYAPQWQDDVLRDERGNVIADESVPQKEVR